MARLSAQWKNRPAQRREPRRERTFWQTDIRVRGPFGGERIVTAEQLYQEFKKRLVSEKP